MNRRVTRFAAITMAIALAGAPAPSEAIPPLLLLLVKQIAKDVAQSILKDMLLSTLSGMGCKGIALANALEAFDLRRGGGGAGGLMGMLGGGMPKMPPGMTMPGMPSGMAMPGLPGGMTMPQMPGGMAMPQLPGGMTIPGMPGGMGMPGLIGGMGLGMPGMPGMSGDVAAKMREMMPGAGEMPAGTGIDPEQMARLMQSINQPLSPPETIAVIDELTEVGFLPKAIHSELKECMLFLPAAAPALGMGMGMLMPVIPQLRRAREEMQALSPEEQDEVAAALIQDMKSLPAGEIKSLVEFLDTGFFPKRVSEAVKAGLAAR